MINYGDWFMIMMRAEKFHHLLSAKLRSKEDASTVQTPKARLSRGSIA